MKDKTRYNIRLAQRKGVTVREGSEQDLEICHQLLTATSQRQGFPLPTGEYFLRMWRLLHPRGHLRMFLAEYEGEVLSSMLAIPFGDTVTFKFGGWSGRHGNRHPNELMHWVAMQTVKAEGFRYYDFESFDSGLARAILDGEPLSEPQARTVATFKLGFGGEVRVYPGPYERVSNPVLRRVYNPLSSVLMGSPRIRDTIKRVSKVMRAR
jgi:peptidoglycan pentaglycine glycine transferase (the first glycine)